MSSKGYILTFHSNNITGNNFENNDHVALNEIISLIKKLRIPVLRLISVINFLRRNEEYKLPSRYVCITFDDGPDFDWLDLVHPYHGLQLSMYNILRKHSTKIGKFWLSRVPATSFVIASPEARNDIRKSSSPDNPDSMAEYWWKHAQKSGLIDIGNHGWDHVHPSVRSMKGRENIIESFHNIYTQEEAELQINDAGKYIQKIAGAESAQIFAYPYGQVSEYISEVFLPQQSIIRAAFSAECEPLTSDSNLWKAPRFIYGHHFKSINDTHKLLNGKL